MLYAKSVCVCGGIHHVHLNLQKGVNTYIVKTKFNDVMVVLWATSICMKSNS